MSRRSGCGTRLPYSVRARLRAVGTRTPPAEVLTTRAAWRRSIRTKQSWRQRSDPPTDQRSQPQRSDGHARHTRVRRRSTGAAGTKFPRDTQLPAVLLSTGLGLSPDPGLSDRRLTFLSRPKVRRVRRIQVCLLSGLHSLFFPPFPSFLSAALALLDSGGRGINGSARVASWLDFDIKAHLSREKNSREGL